MNLSEFWVEKVTSQSVSNEISTKKLTFRLTGASPDIAFREISIDLSKSRSEILTEIKTTCGYNPDTQLKFMVNGKMRDVIQIVKLASFGDLITIMAIQEGAMSLTVEQFDLLKEIYQINNQDSNNQEMDLEKIGDFLREIFNEDSQDVRNYIEDLTMFPKDLDLIIKLQTSLESSINDEVKLSKTQNIINEYITENELINLQEVITEENEDKITLWIEDSITGELQEIKIEKSNTGSDIIQIIKGMISNIPNKPLSKGKLAGANPITILINGIKLSESKQIQDILNTIKLPNNQKINLQAIALRERTPGEKLEIRNRLVDDLMRSLDLNEDQMKLLQSDIFNKVRDSKLEGNSLNKGSLFETLMNYYVEKELWFIDYARYVDRIGRDIKLTKTEINNYAPGWDANDVKLIQRMCWAIIFDNRHPITGTKMNLNQWLSFDLHHWMTESGHENKYICLLSALLPLPKNSKIKFGFPDHTTISNQINYNNMGLTWQNDIVSVLNSIVIEGQAPKSWNRINQKAFNDYIRYELDENTRKLITSLLFISYI